MDEPNIKQLSNRTSSRQLLIQQQNNLRNSFETFFKDGGKDVLENHILTKLNFEDTIRLALVSKSVNCFLEMMLPKVIQTNRAIPSFQMVRPWISEMLRCFMCKNLPIFNGDLKFLPNSLEEIELGMDQNITNEGVKNFPRYVKKLFLYYGFHISNPGLLHLPPTLTHLTLYYNSTITDIGLRYLPSTLLHLNLYTNINITDVGIKNLPRNLLSLNLHENVNITNEGLKNMPPNLVSLVLHRNNNITDEGLKYLPKSVTHLDLHSTRSITDVGLKSLPLDGMKYLDLFFNKKIALTSLKMVPPNLEFLSFSCTRIK